MIRLRGLSLLEMVIVLALITVLAALSLPMLSQANAEARSVVCRQNIGDIGNAVTGYIRDYGRLPHLAELPPHEGGISLPELVQPRVQSSHVLYCPSDETERSQMLDTSYRWRTTWNGLEYSGFERLVDQPLLSDREPFHVGADIATNELVMRRHNGKFVLAVTGAADEGEEEEGEPEPMPVQAPLGML